MKEKEMIIGSKFGRLTILSPTTPYKSPKGRVKRKWKCKCDCGNITTAKEYHLLSGHTTSCGCAKAEALVLANEKRRQMGVGVKRPRLVGFRKSVLARDKGRCVVCRSKKQVQVHHLHNFIDNLELARDVNNGVTLCAKCHTDFHIWNGGFNSSCDSEKFLKWALKEKETNLLSLWIERGLRF